MMHRLVAGRAVAALATALIPTALTLAVIRATGSATDLGLVLAAELVPLLLLLPVGGVLADRIAPRRLALVTDLARCAAQLAIGVALLAGHVSMPVLAGLAALTGVAVAFGVPAVSPLVTSVVAEGDRLKANARIGVATGVAQMAGPSIAGALTLAVHPGWSFIVAAGLFAGSALTLGGLRPQVQAAAVASAQEVRAGFGAELREGWSEVKRHPWFLVSVLGHGVWHLAAGVLLTLGPLIAVSHLGGETSWVVIAQAGSIGLIAGVFAAPRMRIRRPLAVAAIWAASYGVPLAAFAIPAPIAVVAVAYFVALFGLGVLSPIWETVVQQRIPAEALGRVGSFDALISYAARPLGLAVAAPIASVVGTRLPLLVAAVLVAVANLAVLALPDVRARKPSGLRSEAVSGVGDEATSGMNGEVVSGAGGEGVRAEGVRAEGVRAEGVRAEGVRRRVRRLRKSRRAVPVPGRPG
ncbi:MFS transporter [Streptosporangiaceae bacterium NEAU-GS5]|nr:MFS transporter [Streptosporangiaceae bacterium NEAU-GS5]